MKTMTIIFSRVILLLTLVCAMGATSAAPANHSTSDYVSVVKQINQTGNELVAQYSPENSLAAMDGFSKLYFDQYEGSGMELAVAAISNAVNVKTENLFAQIMGAASASNDAQVLKKHWMKLQLQLDADLELLNSHTANNFMSAFLQAFSILLREGFEALLIVTALLTYLRRSEHQNKVKVIHYGVGAALIASAVTAFLFVTLFKNLGSQREAMEGLTMLFASAVMFYVSYWLFAKRESAKWQSFIKSQVSQALSSSNVFALGLAAFLAVYREGAETILFYQALLIGNKGQMLGIASGFGAACVALLLLYKAMQSASFKIPYRLFFTLTAIFLYYMSFAFIGLGVLELQQAGWVDITPVNYVPQIVWLGIFPGWQNISAQLAFLIPTLGLLGVWMFKQRLKKDLK